MNYCNSHTHVSKVGENYCLECGEKLQPETVKDSGSDLDDIIHLIADGWGTEFYDLAIEKPDDLLDLIERCEADMRKELKTLLAQERNRVLDEVRDRLPEKRHKITGELKDRRANGFNECRDEVKKILEELKHG